MPRTRRPALDPKQLRLLRESLADDLYNRAPVPLLLFIPILYVLYRVLQDAIAARPVLAWIFVGMVLILIPRLALVLWREPLKRRLPDPRLRVALFALAAALLGAGLAAVNLIAAPVVSPEQLALLAIVAAGNNSIAIISMSPSLASYLSYMVPNIASIGVAVLIGPPLQHPGIWLFLVAINLASLIFMATYVHVAARRQILLRLRVDDANCALRDGNERLQAEMAERQAAAAALRERNVELEHANRRLADAHTQLLQAEKLASIGQLAAGIAHEINNPIAFVHSNLTTLGGYAEQMFPLLDAYDDATLKACDTSVQRRLAQLKSAANLDFVRSDLPALISESNDGLARVEKIIQDLREFSQLDDRAEWQPVDLHELLERTLGVAAHEFTGKAAIVREYGHVPTVYGAPAQLNQVLLALLVNAAQAIAHVGTITLRTGSDADWVWLEVADTGCGIDAQNLGRIFDPFFTTKPVGVGKGLGLSVAYNVIQQHGGTIEAASGPGPGATFTVRLPRKRSA